MSRVDLQDYSLSEDGPIVVSHGFRSYVNMPPPDMTALPDIEEEENV